MDFKKELKIFIIITIVFFTAFFLPVESQRFDNSLLESLRLVKWYANKHVILCLIPAFFIAGAISVFISQNAVIKYLGANANKFIAYFVAAVSGTILAVCSCTILPLFSGIYKRGAGLGPATTFLYSGPAINILAIILTARILGTQIGIARAIGAILFSVVIGLLMAFIFRNEAKEKISKKFVVSQDDNGKPIWQTVLYFLFMISILVFVNFGKPVEKFGVWYAIFSYKWIIVSLISLFFALFLILFFGYSKLKMFIVLVLTTVFAFLFSSPLPAFSLGFLGLSWVAFSKDEENKEWIYSSWGYAKLIFPLLLIGVLIAGFLLGRPGHQGMIPSSWISMLVGGNSFFSNFFASVVGAFMYFATLTEVPILQGLIGNGMGKGPALALLLAGPALSLPNMLVIRSVMGTKKMLVFVSLVIVMATFSGIFYGTFF